VEQYKYQLIQPEALLNDGVDDTAIRGKIVLFGFVADNPDDYEDKLFTPMNSSFAGKTMPDMNGIVVHANIISMVLDGKYIKKLPSWVNYVIAVLVGWLFMSYFVRYYLESHIWFHLVAKLVQLATAILFAYIGIFMYDRYRIKLDMKMTLIVILLSVDVIYFYEAWASWMHKKYGFKTIFQQKHH
jgi:CHASE2 domain-containing sensor protein